MTYIVLNKKNGEILSLTNLEPAGDMYPDLDWTYFDEEIIHVLDILEGKRQPTSYICVYDINRERWFLREKSEFDTTVLPITELIYHIPRRVVTNEYDDEILEHVKTHDIVIVKDHGATCYKFLIGSKLERQLRAEDSYHNVHIAFSITEFNNPNILYKMLTVDLQQLVKNHYQIFTMDDINKETDANIPVSMFTNKRYDNYIFFEVV